MAIPEGVTHIGERWFKNSDVGSITIPGSVKEISAEAFCNCKALRRVTFAEGSRLEKIAVRSFCESGIKRVTIPKGVEEIPEGAFS